MTIADEIHLNGVSPEYAAPKRNISIAEGSSNPWEIVDVNYLSLLGEQCLESHDYQKVAPGQRARFKAALSAILKKPQVKQVLDAAPKETHHLDFHINTEGLFLQYKGKNIPLISLASLISEGKQNHLLFFKQEDPFYTFFKEVRRMQEYSEAVMLGKKHIVPKNAANQRIQALFPTVQQQITSEHIPPDFIERNKHYHNTVGNVGGVVRNSLSAYSTAIAESTAITGMALAGGLLSIFSGAFIVKGGTSLYDRSDKVGFTEGKIHGRLLQGIGSAISAVGLGMAVSKAASLGPVASMTGASQIALNAMAPVFPLFGAASLGVSILGAHGLYKTKAFYDNCLQYLDNPDMQDPLQKYRGFTQFLKNELSLSHFEQVKLKIKLQKKFPDLQGDAFEQKFQEEAARIMGKKRLRLERRTDPAIAERVANSVDSLLARLDDPLQQIEAVNEVAALAFEVRKAAFKKMVYYTAMIVVGLLGVAAFIASCVVTGGAPLILLAIVSGIWIVLDHPGLTDKMGSLFWYLFHPGEKEALLHT